jgi:hypothetical protein
MPKNSCLDDIKVDGWGDVRTGGGQKWFKIVSIGVLQYRPSGVELSGCAMYHIVSLIYLTRGRS